MILCSGVTRLELLTVGEAFQDLIFSGMPHMPRSGEEIRTARFVSTIGGGAVITATAGARLGLRTAVISGLSRDASRALRVEKVRVVNVKRATEAHAVMPAAIARQRAAHVHFAFAPRHCDRWAHIVDRLRARGVTTSWDFGWNPAVRARAGFGGLVAGVDFVFVNEAEAVMYAGARRTAAAVAYWRRSARNTVIKLGPRGSRWVAGEPTKIDLTAPAPRVRAVDTTGAGDAFNGGFLFGLLGGLAPGECLRIGNFVGARSTLAAGGVAALPRRYELP